MRKLVAALIVLVLLALVGGAAFVALFGDATGPAAEDDVLQPVPEKPESGKATSRDRVRVGADTPEPAPEPAVPATPEVPVEQVSESDSAGKLKLVVGGTDQPAPGVDVAFLAFDPENPPEWMQAMEGRDPFDVAMEHGRRLRTDIDGTVLVPRFDHWAIVVARSGDARGQTWLDGDETEWTLTLSPMLSVAVRVIDAAGSAVSGVTVAVRAHQYGTAWPLARTDTGPDGTARIDFQVEHVDDEEDPVFDVTALVPFGDPPHEALDPDDLPDDVIELTLPDAGSLRVEVVGPDGLPWTGAATVVVAAEKSPSDIAYSDIDDDPSAARSAVTNGVAELGQVGLGTSLVVSVRAAGGERTARTETIAGPVVAGQQVVHRIQVGDPRPAVFGRLEYDDGTPVAGLALTAQMLAPGNEDLNPWGEDLTCTTDDEGGFRFVLRVFPDPDEKAALQIGTRVRSGDDSWSVKMLTTKVLPALRTDRANDLGTLTIPRPQVLVSGRVFDPDGAPLEATVAVMEVSGWSTTQLDGADEAVSDSRGRFVIEGTTDEEQLRLGVACPGFYLEEMPMVARGATDVVVTMSRAGRLAGSVIVPDGMESWSIDVIAQGDVTRNHDTDHRWGDPSIDTYVRQDGTFEFDTLRPGTAKVSIRIGWDDDDTVLAVENLRVVAGETLRDPRLQNVDLAALLGGFAVTVLDTDRKPIPGASVHARRTGGGHGPFWQEFTCDASGVAHVRIRADELEVVATADGHRFETLSGVDGDRTVILQEAVTTQVTLRLSQTTPLPDPPHELRAQLGWAGALGTDEPGEQWGSDPRAASQGFREDHAFGKEREVTIQVANPGRYRVSLWLWERAMSSASGSTVATVPGVVIVTVPGDGSAITQEVAADAEALASRLETED